MKNSIITEGMDFRKKVSRKLTTYFIKIYPFALAFLAIIIEGMQVD